MWTNKSPLRPQGGLNFRQGVNFRLRIRGQWPEFELPENTNLKFYFANYDEFGNLINKSLIPGADFSGPRNDITIDVVATAPGDFDYLLVEASGNSSYDGIKPIVLFTVEVKFGAELGLTQTWIDPTDNNIYIGHLPDGANKVGAIEVSMDDGNTFQTLNNSIIGGNFQTRLFRMEGLVQANDNPVLFMSTINIASYQNSRVTYDQNSGHLHDDIRDLFSDGVNLYVASDGGVTKFTSQTDFSYLVGKGLNVASIFNIDIRKGTNEIGAGSLDFGSFHKPNNSSVWTDIGGFDGFEFTFGDKQLFDHAWMDNSERKLFIK